MLLSLNFYYIIIDARNNVRLFNIESHRFHIYQVKNNPMRKDVDSTGNKTCTTKSHIWSSPEVRLSLHYKE